ncbi:SMAD/FHA domain-containing protein [Teratosphaeria destructans]|uniref:SMAD/FHA domain-containing protein n=1 Tax=Teratosphaeria destructans TaxID=418781 RepID=A0A9W7W3H1_9PEZI|nr:SMAD/FHA domain-containing protein [Teratosphaeria destructans]
MSVSRQRSTSLEDHRSRDTTHRRDRRDRDGDSRRDRDRHGHDDNEDSDRRRRHRRSRGDRFPEEEDEASDSSRRRERRHKRRSRSRDDSRRRRRRSRSPDPKRPRRSHSRSHSPPRRSRAPLPSQTESYRGTTQPPSHPDAAPPKQKPNFRPTGLLAKEANTIAGTTTVLKYHEPPEARQPPAKDAWRLYVFKTRDLLDTIPLPDRSCWLFGRDRTVADVPLDHPSVSKQHAVLQFRHLTATDAYGGTRGRVKPYLIDLESANGTRLNGEALDPRRYVELRDGDVVAFGESEREYVLMLPKP